MDDEELNLGHGYGKHILHPVGTELTEYQGGLGKREIMISRIMDGLSMDQG